MTNEAQTNIARAYFGGGCFWCTEAVFKRIRGIVSVTPGYAGGQTKNPNYIDVSRGDTGHAEVVQLIYKPKEISYSKLLMVFFKTHDPTTLDRQGADQGSQYRSIILTSNEFQHETAINFINTLNVEKIYPQPIVTQVVPIEKFYPAESYHKDYYERNQDQLYCRLTITPKLMKLEESILKLIDQPELQADSH